MEAVVGDFNNKAGLVKALGFYWGRKRLRPEFEKKIFVMDEPLVDIEESETDKHYITELEAKLADAVLEMEKAKAQLVPALATTELEKLYPTPFEISPPLQSPPPLGGRP